MCRTRNPGLFAYKRIIDNEFNRRNSENNNLLSARKCAEENRENGDGCMSLREGMNSAREVSMSAIPKTESSTDLVLTILAPYRLPTHHSRPSVLREIDGGRDIVAEVPKVTKCGTSFSRSVACTCSAWCIATRLVLAYQTIISKRKRLSNEHPKPVPASPTRYSPPVSAKTFYQRTCYTSQSLQ